MVEPGGDASDSDLIRAPGLPGTAPPAGHSGHSPSGARPSASPLVPSGVHGIPSGVHGIPSGVHGVPSGVHGAPPGVRPSLPPGARLSGGQIAIPSVPAPPPPASPAPGITETGASRLSLAGYEILSELGRGSSGTVYLARRQGGGPVALKVLAGKAAANSEARARFVREATVSSRVSHPGIVRVLDAGEAQGHLYIAMEFVAGTTLRDRLATAPLTPLEAARVVSHVARAVEAAHDAGIVHRDLKPGNILLDRAGRPHVADFGLARDELSRDQLTVSGDVLGTPMYMSPEQVRGQRVERSADVWALGVILWESIAGRVPFVGRSFPEVAESIQRWSPVAPSGLAVFAVPRALDMVCLAALAPDPRSRPSAGELARELEAIANEVSTKQLAPRSRRSWGIVLAAATGASAGILFGASTMRTIDVERQKDRDAEAASRLAAVKAEGEAVQAKLDDALRLVHASDEETRKLTAQASESGRAIEQWNDALQRERVTWGASLTSAIDRTIEDLALAPVTSTTAGLRARLLLHRGRHEEAARCCTQARLSSDDLEQDPELLRIEADASWQLGKQREALTLLERLARTDPQGARGQYAQSFLELSRGSPGDLGPIVRRLEHTVEIDPTFEAGLTLAATILVGTGADENAARAATDANAAIHADPTSAEAYYQRSYARWARCMTVAGRGQRPSLQDQEGVVRDLQAARSLDPRPELFVYEGKMYCAFDRANEALPSIEAAIQLSGPRSARRAHALAWRGIARLLLKDPRRALDDWLEAIATNPQGAGDMLAYVPKLPPDLLDIWKKRVPPEWVKELRARESGERRAPGGR